MSSSYCLWCWARVSAFGRVYEETYHGQRVAVKQILDLVEGAELEMLQASFAQELEVLGRCEHPNILRILAACMAPPRPCLVMEVLHIASEIAQGLAYLHPTILHRDLKPANVLINDPWGERPVVKLSDFGLSRLRNTVVLTAHPEAGTDIYSYGVVVWEMLAGCRPWEGLGAVNIACQVTLLGQRLEMPPRGAPGSCRSRWPGQLCQMLEECWDPVPVRRPAAEELAKLLMLVQQAEDRVTEDKAVADPPLLRLEVEAAAAYLSVNMAITAAASHPAASPDASALARLTNAQERLVHLCLTTLSRYTLGPSHMPQPRYIVVGRTSGGAPVLMAPPAVEFASFSPLALSSLVALGELEEPTFRKHVAELFPLLTQLIRADYAPADVYRALSTLFARRMSSSYCLWCWARELEVLGRCEHPNILRILAACMAPPRPCLVMELMDTSLDKLLYAKSGLLPMPLVLHIASEIAQGLAYLHPTILHRDLKPANVLINDPWGERPVVKLSDIYAYGVVIWEMLAGCRPWEGLGAVHIACQITLKGRRLGMPPRDAPGSCSSRWPGQLCQMLEECWDPVPARRPAAEELAKRLMLVQQ
ncbi:putative serine/threonine-protein kinase, partial [Tetrabaena socialis]